MSTAPWDMVLCYVEGPCAYFTSQALDAQYGDDWDDAPYEHNAGRPYEWRPNSGKPEYTITHVYWDGLPLSTPDEYAGSGNSPYSVEAINAGAVPWLIDWYGTKRQSIMAGMTLDVFVKTIRKWGGKVYLEVTS